MPNDSAVVILVVRARNGDKDAWDELVERYAPLVWSLCRKYRLSAADAEDVGQTVWLRLVEHLSTLREPAALPGWIATTIQHECLRLLRAARRVEPMDALPEVRGLSADELEVEEELLRCERNQVIRDAFVQLPPRCQLLLSLLMRDPPAAYGEISRVMRMPVGSIGPNRARCLEKLRKHPAVVALIEDELQRRDGGDDGG